MILHGQADSIVPVSFAVRLRDAVVAHGGRAEVTLYPGVGHVFNLRGYSESYDATAARDAWGKTLAFLRRQLDPAGR